MTNRNEGRSIYSEGRVFSLSSSGILLPSLGLILPEASIGVPIIPTDDEVLKHAKVEENPVVLRTSAELALADQIPHIFLAQELAKKLPDTKESEEVITYLRGKGVEQVSKVLKTGEILPELQYSPSSLERRKIPKKVADVRSHETYTLISTAPGAVEQAGTIIIDLLNEPYFRHDARRIIIGPVSQLLRDYRRNIDRKLVVPEMPDLISSISKSIDTFPTRPETRFSLYTLLEQITIPDSLGNEILQKMDHMGDLDHPLAFQLTLAQVKHPDSDWIKAQEERRNELLELLGRSTQEVFDDFDRLMLLSRGLVFSADLVDEEVGKAGLEIEFQVKKQKKNGIYSVRKSERNEAMSATYFKRGKGIDDQWTIHRDLHGREEVTRADNHLDFGFSYMESLVDLYKWFGDYATILEALHIHLDQETHPFLPSLGGLFEGSDPGRNGNNVGLQGFHSIDRSARALNTWEIRSVALPQAVGNLHPGRLADIMYMFMDASSFDNEAIKADKLSVGDIPTLQKLIFGHLITYLDEPYSRLSALMALHDAKALKYCNPLAFIHSFKDESLPKIVEILRERMSNDEDKGMVETLERISSGDTNDLIYSMPLHTKWMTRHILGSDLSKKVAEHDYQLYEELGSIEQDKARMLSKYGVTLHNRLRLKENVSGFDRDALISHIVRDAVFRTEQLQTKLQQPQMQETLEGRGTLERQKEVRSLFENALRFDRMLANYIDTYLLNMYVVYDPTEYRMLMGGSENWERYTADKNAQLAKVFHLFYTLEQVSDSLVKESVVGNTVDIPAAFSFDEEKEFNVRMEPLYVGLASFSPDSENEEIARLWRFHDGIRKVIPVIQSDKQARKFYSTPAALLFWANEYGINDERLDPVRKIVVAAYEQNNLPRVYDNLLEHGFLGINSEVLGRPDGLGKSWK